MAQQAEHVLGKDEVTGSNPVNSSNKTPRWLPGCFILLQKPLFSMSLRFYLNPPSVTEVRSKSHLPALEIDSIIYLNIIGIVFTKDIGGPR
jgi:hypothetical protein